MEKTYKGYLKSYLFQRGSFKIASIKLDTNETLIIQGVFEDLDPKVQYEFIGSLEDHPKYGQQLKVTSVNKLNSDIEKTSNSPSVKLTVKGFIKKYLFEDSSSSFKIMAITLEDNEEMIVKGDMPPLDEASQYEFTGTTEEHSKFGTQLKVLSLKKIEGNTKESIINYLKSDKFSGIGEITATKIYELLGNDCLKLIISDHKVLLEISSFKEDKAKQLQEELIRNQTLEEVYLKLFEYGLSTKMIDSLINVHQENAVNILKENPYKLINDTSGLNFTKCDELAKTLGIMPNDSKRLYAGLIHVLKTECYNGGHTFLTKNQLLELSLRLLNTNVKNEYQVTLEILDNVLINNKDDLITLEESRVYESSLYEAETLLASKILSIKDMPNARSYKADVLNDTLKQLEEHTNIKYETRQKEAIFSALNNKLSVITGGPGTGKTTIINAILQMYLDLNNTIMDESDILLVAPTGRAAKRISETTSLKAQTIHKALGYTKDGYFEKTHENKLDESLIVIDEASMIDTKLMYYLFRCIKDTSQVIIVGDVFQLPSIAPGRVLYDLIHNDNIKVVELVEILRQASNSDIINLSSMVKYNDYNSSIFRKKEEVFFYEKDEFASLDFIKDVITAFIKKGGSLLKDLQILAPMYKGDVGINSINKMVQDNFNDSNEYYEIKTTKKIFKLNDKVLQLANNPELSIMNGDIGVIKGIERNNSDIGDNLLIDFDGLIVNYPISLIDDLTLGYAISIHKSQGSEYKNVLMPMVPSYFVMLKRNLIYTGITRAKEKFIMVGNNRCLAQAINSKEETRQTSLLRRLRQDNIEDVKINIKNDNNVTNNKIIINDPSIPFDYLGENLNGKTPYDF